MLFCECDNCFEQVPDTEEFKALYKKIENRGTDRIILKSHAENNSHTEVLDESENLLLVRD